MKSRSREGKLLFWGKTPQQSLFIRKLAVSPICALLFILITEGVSSKAAEGKRLIRIGTGGPTGVYYPVGKAIAQGLTESPERKEGQGTEVGGVPGCIAVAQLSAGSIDNVLTLAAGEIELALVQADVAAKAFHGEDFFAGNEKVRAVRAVASLYPEKLQIVTRRDANIQSISDLRGKRISLDESGSGTLAVMRIVLQAHGLSERDLAPVYLKPAFTRDKVLSGELHGFAMMAGTPMEAVTRLHQVDLSLVPIAPDMLSRISRRYPFLTPGKIPAGVYPGIHETPTLQVHALLLVGPVVSDELAYRVTAALWSERTLALLRAGHPQGAAVNLASALEGVPIPLHPGAERFYRERGLRPTEAASP
ncbi:MAG: TAXI family TRAP transporter solute-binding subunit [Deltaproteobacteria bacterium]|nr:TAXI family TRAP transporter solute-binding subunit [Deltaproteobacteria bacterium]